MDVATDYALFDTADSAPETHRTLSGLVRQLHRTRADAAIECVDDHLTLTDDRRLRVVSVYRLDDGSRTALLGHAYLRGAGHEALERALAAARPDRGPGRAASPAAQPCLSAH